MELEERNYHQHTRSMLSHINVGTGEDCTIRELVETVAKVTGFNGRLTFDVSKSGGARCKLLDVSLLFSFGWRASIELEDGLRRIYQWFFYSSLTFRSN